jgi:beta-1,4-mannosyl-glycoprotein beta-1,4-N-acetylglucosaminyltransferase
MTKKIFDCITFFDNNFMFELRYNILKHVVDFFIICESRFDHKGREKKINFIKKKEYDLNKVKHFILEEPFPKNNDPWQNQAIQREFLLKCTDIAGPEDYIFFSDPDEIPKPEILINFELNKKYGIFMQKFFNYKFNLFNAYESPWEGTRVSKKKNLKSIDFMRQKVKSKNLKFSFFRIDKEKNIEIFDNGGWHFNNIFSAEEISLKLQTFAHTEFQDKNFSSISSIKDKIKQKVDLFGRGHVYKNVKIDSTYPDYLVKNFKKYKDWID